MKTYVLIDYKGKHKILDDYDFGTYGPLDIDDTLISEDEINDDFLKNLVINSDKYGVSPYMGKDPELLKKIEQLTSIFIEK